MTGMGEGNSSDTHTAAWRYGFGLGFLTAGLLALGAWEISTSSGLWLAIAIASVVCISLGVLMKLAEHA